MIVDRVQVRSEISGLQYFSTVREARDAADIDQSIWKISFNTDTGERIRLVRHNGAWTYQPMEDDIRYVD